MKRFLIIFAAFCCLLSCGKDGIVPSGDPLHGGGVVPEKDDPDEVDWSKAVGYVFDMSVIPEIHVSVSREQWDALLEAYDKDRFTSEYILCDVEYRKGAEVTKIGEASLRLKGNLSRSRPSVGSRYHHVHFGLDFHRNHPDKDHTVRGVRRVDLKWFNGDPDYVREIYCYDLFRRFGVWTAVNDVYSRLWLKVGSDKEVYYGVYGLMEHIDRNYLRTRLGEFGSKDGDLWKCAFGSDLADENASMGLDDDRSSFVYELKTGSAETFPAAKARLQDFIRNMKGLSGSAFDQWISSRMDVDLLLKTYAVNVAVGMWDDYWNNTNNYYLYIVPGAGKDYKVWFIPYDYDNTLGTSYSCGVIQDSGRHDPYKWGMDSVPMMTKVLQNAEWRARYKQYLQQLCSEEGPFYYRTSIDRIKAWQSAIAPFVSNDTYEDMSIIDKPANWGNHTEYRLVENSVNNYFKVKAATVEKMQ